MHTHDNAIPDSLPRLPYRDGSLREDVTIQQLLTGDELDSTGEHQIKWIMKVTEYTHELTESPDLPTRFKEFTCGEVKNVRIGECSHKEILVLATWLIAHTEITAVDSSELFSDS
jgi:hypothetical protein